MKRRRSPPPCGPVAPLWAVGCGPGTKSKKSKYLLVFKVYLSKIDINIFLFCYNKSLTILIRINVSHPPSPDPLLPPPMEGGLGGKSWRGVDGEAKAPLRAKRREGPLCTSLRSASQRIATYLTPPTTRPPTPTSYGGGLGG